MKKERGGKTSVLLVYPNHYPIAMSNLGFQTVYSAFNALSDVVAERAFLPDPSTIAEHRRTSTILFSLESQMPASEFDLVAFSISFEEDYLNIPVIMELARIPLASMERGKTDPLVMAGGTAVSLNPEPIADFIDCFVIGDGEGAVPKISGLLGEHGRDREALLRALSAEDGFYIPSFYEWSFDGPVVKSVKPLEGAPERVRALRNEDVDAVPVPKTAVLTLDTEFSDTVLVEIERGCGRGCRFCAAGFLYLPPRWRDKELVKEVLRGALKDTGKIGLVGAAVSEHPALKEILGEALREGARMTLSSLRADMINPELLSLLKEAGYTTITMAPEAATERLRAVINKGMSESEIRDAVRMVEDAGFRRLKLYFMTGLPTETDDDVSAIIETAKELKGLIKGGNLSISINPFIPKPFTPFAYHPMERPEVLARRHVMIKDGLKALIGEGGVMLSIFSEKEALFQAFLSRGDRRAGTIVEEGGERGWRRALKANEGLILEAVLRERGAEEIFPWDIIDFGFDKGYLYDEYLRGLEARQTPPCDVGRCHRCGVC